MRVLVAVASRHGSTQDIAFRISKKLSDSDLIAEVKNIEDEGSINLNEYSAVVMGSAVYAGNWLKPASLFAVNHSEALASAPLWLFSSGPVGNPSKPRKEESVNIEKIIESLHPVEHKILPGRIDKSRLGFAEKAIILAVGAVEGDFRDWEEIDEWASDIARLLQKIQQHN